MNSLSSKLSTEAILQSIRSNFTQVAADHNNQPYWRESVIGIDLLLAQLQADEAFIAVLKRFKGETYHLDKSTYPPSIRKTTPAGVAFYDWIRSRLWMPDAPSEFEFGPEMATLRYQFQVLGLSPLLFEPQNPLAPVAGSIVLQGEFVDGFGHRAYSALTNARFRAYLKRDRDEIRAAVKKADRYAERLEQNHPVMRIDRLELHMQTRPDGARPTRRDMGEQINALTAQLDELESSGKLFGYWWQLRHLPELGFGIHVVVFSDPANATSQEPAAVTAVREAWREVTQGHGHACQLFHFDGSHRYWGANTLTWAGNVHSSLASTFASIRLMLEGEKYLRIKRDRKYAHWGMGKMPPAVKTASASWPTALDLWNQPTRVMV